MAIITDEINTSTYEELRVKYYNPCCHKKFSLRHPRHDASATLRSLSEQPFDFTMHYNGHRESTYVTVNRSNGQPIHMRLSPPEPRINAYDGNASPAVDLKDLAKMRLDQQLRP